MIHLPRRLIRQFRMLLRRVKYRRLADVFRKHIQLQTDGHELPLRALTDELGLEVRLPCSAAPQTLYSPPGAAGSGR